MTVNALYNVVDRMFIGRFVGPLALSGLAIGFPIMTLFMAISMLIGLGTSASVAIHLGEGKKKEAELLFGNAMTLYLISSVLVTTLGLLFLKPVMALFGASEDVLPYSMSYMRIIIIGFLFHCIGFGMNHSIRAEGNARIAMLTMFLGAGVNIVLDALFIIVFEWGVEGAAWATIIAQFASAAWVFSYFLRKESTVKFKIPNLKPNFVAIKNILAIGSSSFAMQTAASVIWLFINRSLLYYGGENGDLAIAAMAIINSVSMFIFMPCFGINQAAQPIIGFNYGAKKYKRVKRTLFRAIGAATGICILGFFVVMIFPESIISFFNKDNKELTDLATMGLRVFLIFLPIIGFQIVGTSYFQATGQPHKAMFLTLSRQAIFVLPLLIILPKFFGLKGIFLAAPISDIASVIITWILLMIDMRKLTARQKEIVDQEKILLQAAR
jgi:putative MATE family efflux protein